MSEGEDIILITASNTDNDFIFDKDMSQKLQGYIWSEDKNGYLRAWISGISVHAHNVILGRQKGAIADHINRNIRDNRRCNLRIVTRQHNKANSGIPKNSKSGFKGVSFYSKYQKYRAYIKVNYKHIFLGYFDKPEEAANAYDKAAIKYFGNYALTNKNIRRMI